VPNKRPPKRWWQRESTDLGIQVVLSHPILIILSTHSRGKYDLHDRTFCSERSMSAGHSAISGEAFEQRSGAKIEESIFINGGPLFVGGAPLAISA
jgi:hypothetical protein